MEIVVSAGCDLTNYDFLIENAYMPIHLASEDLNEAYDKGNIQEALLLEQQGSVIDYNADQPAYVRSEQKSIICKYFFSEMSWTSKGR